MSSMTTQTAITWLILTFILGPGPTTKRCSGCGKDSIATGVPTFDGASISICSSFLGPCLLYILNLIPNNGIMKNSCCNIHF